MKAIPVEQRANIYALVQEGYPTRVVANKAKVSQSMVVKICKRYAAEATFLPEPRSGCPRLLTENQENPVQWL
ncbi:2392_t:CDS:2 [Ambispora gerdemannii]|uniref:2392_t:CDS:1 n=1 Tax=Ambispora gerdemannii TaxID=144530 RepID=A0A9N8ZIJ4_9GLOM|nr:2392_t:CDS:2 [Ambispora gerdemannii]